jgi:hypothetical protein
MVMLQPTLIYNENLMTIVPHGTLSKGGILSSTPEVLAFSFGCTSFKQSKNDLEINLNFQGGEMVNIYLSKECNSVIGEDLQDYFNFFYTIYYILLLIFFGFVITIIYYYFRRNDLTFLDLLTFGRNKAIGVYKYLTDRVEQV